MSVIGVADIVTWLDAQITEVLDEIRASDIGRQVLAPGANPALVKLALKEVYLEIAWYQETINEKMNALIGQFPRSVKPARIKAMMGLQAEEFDHGEMALRDYVALGGEEAIARDRTRMSPGALAVVGFWCALEHYRCPYAYLGALFLLEALTPQVASWALDLHNTHKLDAGKVFVEFHAEGDIPHQKLLKNLIRELVGDDQTRIASVKWGFNGFRYVYPLRLWLGSLERAIASLKS